jgi:uracil-DNA glycosylase
MAQSGLERDLRKRELAGLPARDSFSLLIGEAAACRKCQGMCGRRAVLSELNGAPGARVMFIGEAPGRQGGDRTRIPFYGDQSGRNFMRFIASINLPRSSIFITNAVLCNPRRESGANRTPTRAEMANCSDLLRRQIEAVDPPVIATMGRISLEALRGIEYHQLNLREAAGKVFEWGGRLLVPLYHPSPQVLASHRREAEQLRDYLAVERALLMGAGKGKGVSQA